MKGNLKKYRYNAYVTDVYDGDTITVSIDLGFYTFLHDQKIRLYGINTPEIRKGEEIDKGNMVKRYVEDKILGTYIELETIKNDKKGKYGRWLGIVHYKDGNLNDELWERGFAKRVTY